jgi:hypothetical protein
MKGAYRILKKGLASWGCMDAPFPADVLYNARSLVAHNVSHQEMQGILVQG